jgi:hypothetical protein
MGITNSKNEDIDRIKIKEMIKEVIDETEEYRKNNSKHDERLSENMVKKDNKNDFSNNANSQVAIDDQAKMLEDLVAKFMKEQKTFGSEKQDANWEPGQLNPIIGKYITTVLPGQLPDDVAVIYVRHVIKKFLKESQLSGYLVQEAEVKPSKIRDVDFCKFITQSAFSKSIFALNQLPYGRDEYSNLFKLDTIDYCLDDYYLIDATPVRALRIQKEYNLWVAPSVVLFKKEPNSDRLMILAISIENFNHITDDIINTKFPDTLKNLKLVYPSDGLTWEMAKLHTLQNLFYIIVFGEHQIMHHSLTSPIAIVSLATKNETISKDSIIAKIFATHTFMQVPFASYLYARFHSLPYPEFNVTQENGGITNLVKRIVEGWEGHPIYEPSRDLFTDRNENIGCFKKLTFGVRKIVSEFISKTFKIICDDPNEIQFMKLFQKQLWATLPTESFLRKPYANPDGDFDVLRLKDLFEKLLTFIVYIVIEHALDHTSFANSMAIHRFSHTRIHYHVPIDDKSKQITDSKSINEVIANINTFDERLANLHLKAKIEYNYSMMTFTEFFDNGGYFKTFNHKKSNQLHEIERAFILKLEKIFQSELATDSLDKIGISINF